MIEIAYAFTLSHLFGRLYEAYKLSSIERVYYEQMLCQSMRECMTYTLPLMREHTSVGSLNQQEREREYAHMHTH